MQFATAQEYCSNYLYFPADGGLAFSRERFVELVRSAQAAVERVHGINLTTINPFGFEVFDERRLFLNRILGRFYVYIYADQVVRDAAPLEECFLDEFRTQCAAHDPRFATSIAVMAARTGKHVLLRPPGHLWGPTNRLIVTEFRHSDLRPLRDYAHYLLGCVPGILESRLVEMERLQLRSMARARIFQIFLILHRALAQTCLGLPELEPQLRSYLIAHRSTPRFYFEPKAPDPPSRSELEALRAIQGLLVEIDAQVRALNYKSVSVGINVTAFHGDVSLTYSVPKEHYDCFCRTIEDAYNAFWIADTC